MATGLSNLQRKVYGEKLVELANITLTALVLGQFLSEKGFIFELAALGLVIFLLCYLGSYFMLKGVKG